MNKVTKVIREKTGFNINESYEGETIEEKIERIVQNNEPITDGAPLIYTEKSEGVVPGYDIRTDRFDVAIEAMDKVTATNIAKGMAEAPKNKGEKEGESGETPVNTSD